jgi:predicted Zn-dependent protease
MAQVFRRLHERDKNRQVPLPSFLRSHPFHIDRFEAIQDERNRLVKANPQQKLVIGRTNLKQRKPHP